MAFGKTKEQILAEEFPGKTAQEIKDMIASFDDIKAKAEKLTAAEAATSLATGELATVKARLAEIEKGSVKTPGSDNTPPERPDWGEDADAAFNDRIKPVVGGLLGTQAEMVYDNVVRQLERDQPLFSKLRSQFDEMLKKSTLQARASREYVTNCFDVVLGRNFSNIQRDQAAGKGEFFVESGRSQGNNPPPPADASKTLDDKERAEARKFGLTDEQWLKTRNSIQFVGGR